MDEEPSKKPWKAPKVIAMREIESITCVCPSGGSDTGQDKLAFDPNTSLCFNPMT